MLEHIMSAKKALASFPPVLGGLFVTSEDTQTCSEGTPFPCTGNLTWGEIDLQPFLYTRRMTQLTPTRHGAVQSKATWQGDIHDCSP